MSDPAFSEPPAQTPLPQVAMVENPKTVADVIREVAPEVLKKVPAEKKALLVIEKTSVVRTRSR